MTGPYNFQTKMVVLNCPTRCHFRIRFASSGSLRVKLWVVIGLVLGLMSLIEQYFRILFVFFVAVFTVLKHHTFLLFSGFNTWKYIDTGIGIRHLITNTCQRNNRHLVDEILLLYGMVCPFMMYVYKHHSLNSIFRHCFTRSYRILF